MHFLTSPFVVLPLVIVAGYVFFRWVTRFEPKDTTVHTEPSVNSGIPGYREGYDPGYVPDAQMKYGVPTGTPRVAIASYPADGVEYTTHFEGTTPTDEAP